MKTSFYGTLVPERDAAGRLRRVAEHEIPVEVDDGGQAMIAEFSGSGELFVRVQSWDETKQHGWMSQLMGRRIRVTIEAID